MDHVEPSTAPLRAWLSHSVTQPRVLGTESGPAYAKHVLEDQNGAQAALLFSWSRCSVETSRGHMDTRATQSSDDLHQWIQDTDRGTGTKAQKDRVRKKNRGASWVKKKKKGEREIEAE